MAAQIEGGNRPDLILFGQTYDGRDVAGRTFYRVNPSAVGIIRTASGRNTGIPLPGVTIAHGRERG